VRLHQPQQNLSLLRRYIFDSSRAPASGVAGRLPGIFEDRNLVGPEDDALREMARRSRQNGRP
jgi:hypothetical protein